MVTLLGSGTSPNESLHYEVNSWYRNNTTVFPTTLTLELRVARMSKLLAHNAALYRPTLRQMRSVDVLPVAVLGVRLAGPAWQKWCGSQVREAAPRLAAVQPLADERKALKRRIGKFAHRVSKLKVAYYLTKKPASATKKPASAFRSSLPVMKRPASKTFVASRKTDQQRHKIAKRTPFTLQRSHLPSLDVSRDLD